MFCRMYCITAPKLKSSRGKDIADAVYSVLNAWDLLNKLAGMGLDTIASNSDPHTGACFFVTVADRPKVI